jgi:ABC-type multidrug transport system fused ATPase/permease subunit
MLPSTKYLKKYSEILRWYFRTLWGPFSKELGVILATSVASIGFIGLGLLILFQYAKSLESGSPLTLPFHWSLGSRDEITLFGVAGACALILFIGFFLNYLSKIKTADLCVELYLHLTRRVANYPFGVLPKVPEIQHPRRAYQALNSLMLLRTRRISFGVRRLPEVLQNAFTFAAGVVFLFYINWQATLILTFALSVSLPFYFRNYRRTSHTTRMAPGAARAFRAQLNSFAANRDFLAPSKNQETLPLSIIRGLREKNQIFYERRKLRSLTDFTGHGILALVSAITLSYLTLRAMNDQIDWVTIGAFLVSLKFTVNGLRSASIGLNFLMRSYPHIEVVTHYFSNESAYLNTTPGDIPETFQLSTHRISKSAQKTLDLTLGEPVLLFSPSAPRPWTLNYFSAIFAPQSKEGQAQLSQQSFIIPDVRAIPENILTEDLKKIQHNCPKLWAIIKQASQRENPEELSQNYSLLSSDVQALLVVGLSLISEKKLVYLSTRFYFTHLEQFPQILSFYSTKYLFLTCSTVVNNELRDFRNLEFPHSILITNKKSQILHIECHESSPLPVETLRELLQRLGLCEAQTEQFREDEDEGIDEDDEDEDDALS